MKKMQFILFSLLFGILASNAIAQNRYYPANSIRCTNALVFNYIENADGHRVKISPPDTIYIEMWTGNDTIVDGRECVTLWPSAFSM